MAVKTKPRHRGITIEVKPTFDVSEQPIDTTMYQDYKPWWQRIINRLLLFKT